MEILSKPITDLASDPANLRLHGEVNIQAIKASLQRFGQQKPIVIDGAGVVRAGNGTLEAARLLGWTEIDVVVTELEGSEATAYAIADNRTSELAEWDDVALAQQLKALEEVDQGLLDAIGFDAEDIANLAIHLDPEFSPGDEEEQGKLDEKNPITCPECGNEFTP